MTDRLELAERVEKATEASRELDMRVKLAVLGIAYDEQTHKHTNWPTAATPAYTASLDAAMSLVPEGWRYAGSETITGEWYAHLITRGASPRSHAEAHAATGPLSITAAALRASHSQSR